MRSRRETPTGALLMALAVALTVAGLCHAPSPAAAAAAGEPSDQRPNVVVVMTDDQTYRDAQLMPNFRRLAARGASFTKAFTSYPICCPARATFLTGQYTHNHGVKSNFFATGGGFDSFTDQENALPGWLHEAGYSTAFVGKYMNEYGGRDPELVPPGWDDWHGLVDYSTYNFFNWAINRNGTLSYYGDRDYIDALLELGELSANAEADTPARGVARAMRIFDPIEFTGSEDQDDYQPDVTGQIANETLERLLDGGQPFFLYYAPIASHRETDFEELGGIRQIELEKDPRPPARYEHTYDGVGLPVDPSFNEADVSDKPKTVRDRELMSEETIEKLTHDQRGALGSLRAVDDSVGEMIEALRRAGELDNTLFIYTSDQGFMQGQHRIEDNKYIPYEPSIRIPLAITGPGVPRGEKIDELVGAQDITTTIVDAAGAVAGREQDGVSLLPRLRGDDELPQRDILLQALAPVVQFELGNQVIDAQVPYYGVRTERYKYINWSFGDEELYDLRRDPYELENIAREEWASELRERLAARAEALRVCAGRSCVDRSAVPAATAEPLITHRTVGRATAIVVLLALAAAFAAAAIQTARKLRAR